MIELQQNGIGALKKYISEHLRSMGTAQGTSDTIKTTLSNVIKSITICVDCVKDGENKNCHFTSLTEPCSRCKTLQQMGQKIYAVLVSRSYMFPLIKHLPRGKLILS